MDENQNICKNLFIYYQFLLRNLEIDIKAMNNLIHSPKLVQKRKFRKPKKTNIMEFLKKGEYKIGELTKKEKERIDAITKYASLTDLIQKFYKMGVIIAYVYFEAFNKDIMSVFDSTDNYEYFNILSKDKKKRDIKKLNDTLNINVEEQFSKWKFLKQGYILRNTIVHNNGEITENFINEMSNLNNPIVEDINETKNPTIDFKHAFGEIILLIEIFFKFILKQVGLRVCCHCKIPFIDKPNYLKFAPLCHECRNRSRE